MITASSTLAGTAFVRAVRLPWESAGVWLLGTPLKVVLTLVLALVARRLAHRAVTGAVNGSIARAEAARAKREQKRALPASTATARERHRQRTLTMGSLLRSIATIVIASVTGLTLLALLGIPLAPLLASAGVGGVALGEDGHERVDVAVLHADVLRCRQQRAAYQRPDLADRGPISAHVAAEVIAQ